jgi:hypothetical protein
MAENENNNQGSGDASISNQPTGRSFGEIVEREDVVANNADENQGDESQTDDKQGEPKAQETEANAEAKADETKGEEEPKLTEKGTKLDPDPLSAAHQQLANEKRIRGQMEQVLASPELLAKFMEEQYGVKVPASTAKAEDKGESAPRTYKAEDFENLEDVANVVNTLQSSFEQKVQTYETQIKQLNTAVQSLLQGGNAERIASKTESDVNGLRSQPELDPKSSDFIDGLESDIAQEYHRLDFDEKTQMYRGNHSIKEIGDRLISIARKARAKGSLQAQTIVKDKSEGKVVTTPKVSDEGDAEKADPASSIAQGINKLFA